MLPDCHSISAYIAQPLEKVAPVRHLSPSEVSKQESNMAWSVDNLVRIASYGGGLKLDATSFTVDSLVRIASYGKSNNAALIIYNSSGLTADAAVRIASYSPGNVIFEL